MTISSASRTASALGLATITEDGKVLDAWFPAPVLDDQAPEDVAALRAELEELAAQSADADRHTHREVVSVTSDLDSPVQDTLDAYLRLHVLSHRLAEPNSINLDNLFSQLPNNVWTNFGPCEVEGFEHTRAALSKRGPVTVYAIDKFPRMVDYVIPTGVRIGDADRVRLGAHLAEGTTVMHEGFVNFNAGSLGSSMIEGRVSAGVVIGEGTDVGGGASIMGTLSGGNTIRISLGEHVLLGANSGVMIPLGDDCVVEAGLYVTAGTLVDLLEVDGGRKQVKARDLAGADNLLFRRNSTNGRVEALPRRAQKVELNEDLHKN